MVNVPLKWVVTQGSNTPLPAGLEPHIDLYRALSEGRDGSDSLYSQRFLRHYERAKKAWALNYRRELQQRPFPDGEACPVLLNKWGKYELTDGHHRAARAVFEGRDKLNVKIWSVSPTWQRLVSDLQSIYQEQNLLYQPIEHPYFYDWRISRGKTRVAKILDAVLPLTKPDEGSYLEIGSCTGYISRSFFREGYRCFGVDIDPRIVGIAEHLDSVFNTRINYVCGDYHPILNEGPGWSIIVCLSVFHRMWVSGERERVGQIFKEFVRRAKIVVLDMEKPGVVINGNKAPEMAEYLPWLVETVGPTHSVEYIGETEGRPIFICKRAEI